MRRIVEILQARKAAYLADDMGLGKTAQAIEVLKHLGCPNCLVVCPAGVRTVWLQELGRWNFAGDAEVVSYNKTIIEDWQPRPYEVLICDEAHYLKTHDSKRTRACLGRLWRGAAYRLLLSGTPVPNGIIDGYTTFHACAPEEFPNYTAFGHQYTNATRNYFTGYWDFKGGRNIPELKRKCSSFMVRRKKEDVLTELPPKVFTKYFVEVAHAAEYSLPSGVIADIENLSKLSHSPEVATRRRALGACKVGAVLAHLKMLLDSAETRLVVFAYHSETIRLLQEALQGAKIACAIIQGGVPVAERSNIIKWFQSGDPEPRVLIGQVVAAGTGITLTAASVCVFAELDWTPANMTQAMDRLHRIGQRDVVQVHYILGQGTMDEQIIDSLREKWEGISKLME